MKGSHTFYYLTLFKSDRFSLRQKTFQVKIPSLFPSILIFLLALTNTKAQPVFLSVIADSSLHLTLDIFLAVFIKVVTIAIFGMGDFVEVDVMMAKQASSMPYILERLFGPSVIESILSFIQEEKIIKEGGYSSILTQT